MPTVLQETLDNLDDTDPRYHIRRFRHLASHHLEYRRHRDQELGKYSTREVTRRHARRVRALENTAYQVGILQPIPDEEKEPPPARRPRDDEGRKDGGTEESEAGSPRQVAAPAAAGRGHRPRGSVLDDRVEELAFLLQDH